MYYLTQGTQPIIVAFAIVIYSSLMIKHLGRSIWSLLLLLFLHGINIRSVRESESARARSCVYVCLLPFFSPSFCISSLSPFVLSPSLFFFPVPPPSPFCLLSFLPCQPSSSCIVIFFSMRVIKHFASAPHGKKVRKFLSDNFVPTRDALRLTLNRIKVEKTRFTNDSVMVSPTNSVPKLKEIVSCPTFRSTDSNCSPSVHGKEQPKLSPAENFSSVACSTSSEIATPTPQPMKVSSPSQKLNEQLNASSAFNDNKFPTVPLVSILLLTPLAATNAH